MESQSNSSSRETITEPYVIGRIQSWMQETIFLTNLLQSIPPSDKTAIEKWLQEQKKYGKVALVTLLQSLLSSAETKVGLNFHLEAQHSKQSNKQISKAPETSNSSGRKEVKAYLVTDVDKPLDEEALTEASGKMSEARLVIKSPYIHSKDLESLAGSIRYPSRAPRFKHIFGVIQDTVDFTVKSDLRFDIHSEPFVFWCDIVYDPASNGCYLHNLSGRSIYLISSGKLPTQHTIDDKRYLTIYSGTWRISIKPDQTPSCSFPIFDILVRDKRFSISADNDNKVATVSGRNLFPNDSQDVQYTPTSFRRTRTDLLELINGETVRIKDLHDDEKTYNIQRLKEIARSQKSHVFFCQHSRLPSIKLVAKVFCFNKESLIHKQMKREIEFLKQLRHPNIISLKAADPRVFALYLEHLPLSLDKNDELDSSWADAKTILFNIASALAYLSKRGIVHYDVKPQNIAFSRKQGAILFDFDLADYTKEPKYGKPGGTFGYLPPETIDKGKSRGFPGDVWALGVTILWIVKIYTYPLTTVVDMDDLHQENSPTYRKVKEQLDAIALRRKILDLRDKVQTLVYKMLEPNTEARVTAAAIHREDDRKPNGDIPAKKRRHS